ncbi:MAG: hypothetical protein PUJ51_08325 [Clostridiales bacterium]|nr:hypothetical protein [Clostridiales bacterium]
MEKYNTIETEGYNNKLKNKLFGLLCEYEKGREWEKFLDSILIELLGFEEERKTINYYILYYKLSSLRYLSYKYFRTTIFDCMGLISKI